MRKRQFLRTHTCTLTDAEVNHLRQLLNHLRLEYGLCEHMKKGRDTGINELLSAGLITQEEALDSIKRADDKTNRLPKYIQHSIKMLEKTIKPFDGDVIDIDARIVLEIEK